MNVKFSNQMDLINNDAFLLSLFENVLLLRSFNKYQFSVINHNFDNQYPFLGRLCHGQFKQ